MTMVKVMIIVFFYTKQLQNVIKCQKLKTTKLVTSYFSCASQNS